MDRVPRMHIVAGRKTMCNESKPECYFTTLSHGGRARGRADKSNYDKKTNAGLLPHSTSCSKNKRGKLVFIASHYDVPMLLNLSVAFPTLSPACMVQIYACWLTIIITGTTLFKLKVYQAFFSLLNNFLCYLLVSRLFKTWTAHPYSTLGWDRANTYKVIPY